MMIFIEIMTGLLLVVLCYLIYQLKHDETLNTNVYDDTID